jgi:hypothetical protein
MRWGPSLDTVVDQVRAAAAAGFAGVWSGQRTGRDAFDSTGGRIRSSVAAVACECGAGAVLWWVAEAGAKLG